MADADRLVAALLQQELDAAQRPYFGNPNLAAQGRRANRAFPFMGAENEQGAFASMLRNLVGSGEAAYSVAHNLGAGLLGRVGGVLTGGLGENNQGPQRAAELTQQMSYEPRMPEARAQLGAVSDLIGKVVDTAKIPPWPLTANLPRVGSGGLAGLEQAAETVGRPMTPPPAFASPLTVYHGSPHKFAPTKNNPLGEFDASKIGTGEGVQAYGYGSPYLAENPGVAGEYRKALANPEVYVKGKPIPNTDPMARVALQAEEGVNPVQFWKERFDESKAALKVANPDFRQKLSADMYEARKQIFNAAKKYDPLNVEVKTGGGFYKADLPDSMIPKMLDWDKPLSQQSADVRKSINQILGRNLDNETGWQKMSGERLYNAIVEHTGMPDKGASASARLRELGIPGIRYLDQGSRFAQQPHIQSGSGLDGSRMFTVNGPKGDMNFGTMGEAQNYIESLRTRNYVIFPGMEKQVKILERDGLTLEQALAAAKERK